MLRWFLFVFNMMITFNCSGMCMYMLMLFLRNVGHNGYFQDIERWTTKSS